MDCKETLAWGDAYLDRELDLSEQLKVEQHLTGRVMALNDIRVRHHTRCAKRDRDVF